METITMTLNGAIFVESPAGKVREYEAMGYKVVKKEVEEEKKKAGK